MKEKEISQLPIETEYIRNDCLVTKFLFEELGEQRINFTVVKRLEEVRGFSVDIKEMKPIPMRLGQFNMGAFCDEFNLSGREISLKFLDRGNKLTLGKSSSFEDHQGLWTKGEIRKYDELWVREIHIRLEREDGARLTLWYDRLHKNDGDIPLWGFEVYLPFIDQEKRFFHPGISVGPNVGPEKLFYKGPSRSVNTDRFPQEDWGKTQEGFMIEDTRIASLDFLRNLKIGGVIEEEYHLKHNVGFSEILKIKVEKLTDDKIVWYKFLVRKQTETMTVFAGDLGPAELACYIPVFLPQELIEPDFDDQKPFEETERELVIVGKRICDLLAMILPTSTSATAEAAAGRTSATAAGKA